MNASQPSPPRTLRWHDAFALATAVSGGLFVSFGATMAAIGALSALAIWTIAALIGWVQNHFFAEMAAMFPHKAGGVPVYAHEAWRYRCAPLGALATFGYWFGWSAVISIVGLTAGGIIQARWMPDAAWGLDFGVVQVGPAQLITIALVALIAIPNFFGAQPAMWVNKVLSVALILPFALLIASPFVTDAWDPANLTWGLGGEGADHWGGWQDAAVWLYLVGWTAYGTEMCAAFTPEYRSRKDAKRALSSSGLFTLAMFAFVPIGIGGLVSQGEAGADPSVVFVNGMASVLPWSWVGDLALIVTIIALVMGVNAGMADGSRALYGAAKERLVPRGLERLNSRGVPALALVVSVVMNVLLIIFVTDPLSILVAANLGYLVAITLAVAGFVLLRHDRPQVPRPIKAGAWAVPTAAVLAVYSLCILVIGSLSSELSGYGGPKELLIGVGILLLSLVLFVYRRRVEERAPLLRDAPAHAVPSDLPAETAPTRS